MSDDLPPVTAGFGVSGTPVERDGCTVLAMVLLLRRPLAIALALGCAVSALASGRFSLRLVVDGAVSFAFVPFIVLMAFAIAYYRGGERPLPFAQAADRFFAFNTPWLVWLLVAAAVGCLVPPDQSPAWFMPLAILGVIAAVMMIYMDIRFFREVLQRTPRDAVRDAAVQGAVRWIALGTYFFGLAIWPEIVTALGRLGS